MIMKKKKKNWNVNFKIYKFVFIATFEYLITCQKEIPRDFRGRLLKCQSANHKRLVKNSEKIHVNLSNEIRALRTDGYAPFTQTIQII